jgi:hypothetical protein
MSETITALIEVLTEKGVVLEEMRILLEEEQECIIALDLARMARNQEAIDQATAKMESLNGNCRELIEKSGAELGLLSNNTLSPIIERAGTPDKDLLSGLQTRIFSCSTALNHLLAVNRGLIQDSLGVVERSISFFNSVLGTGSTYGEEGRMVSGRSGSRLVCKEI